MTIQEFNNIYDDLDSPYMFLYYGVIKIETNNGRGSGFFVRAGNDEPECTIIATCYHVVEGAKQLSLSWFDENLHKETWKNFQTIIVDVSCDLAIITPTDLIIGDAQYRSLYVSWNDIKAGEELFTGGYPLDSNFPLFTEGILSGLAEIPISGTNQRVFVLDTPINPGNSGGPVCDSEGDVLGIVQSKPLPSIANLELRKYLEGVNVGLGYAIPIVYFNDLINQAEKIIGCIGHHEICNRTVRIEKEKYSKFQLFCREKVGIPIPMFSSNQYRQIWFTTRNWKSVSKDARTYLPEEYIELFEEVLDLVLVRRRLGGRFILTGSYLCTYTPNTRKFEKIAQMELI